MSTPDGEEGGASASPSDIRKAAVAAKRVKVEQARAAESAALRAQLLKSHLRRQEEWAVVGPELTKRDTSRREKRLKLADEVRAIGERNRKAALGLEPEGKSQ